MSCSTSRKNPESKRRSKKTRLLSKSKHVPHDDIYTPKHDNYIFLIYVHTDHFLSVAATFRKNNIVFSAKIVGDSVRLKFDDNNSYQIGQQILHDMDVKWSLLTSNNKRDIRFIIRGLPSNLKPTDVLLFISALGFKPRHVAQLKLHNRPSPLFLVYLPMTDKSEKFINVKSLDSKAVTIEQFRGRSGLTQCFRCQRWGHPSTICTYTPRCVICSEAHDAKSCMSNREIDAKCCNCGEKHPANYRGCHAYKKSVQKFARIRRTIKIESNVYQGTQTTAMKVKRSLEVTNIKNNFCTARNIITNKNKQNVKLKPLDCTAEKKTEMSICMLEKPKFDKKTSKSQFEVVAPSLCKNPPPVGNSLEKWFNKALSIESSPTSNQKEDSKISASSSVDNSQLTIKKSKSKKKTSVNLPEAKTESDKCSIGNHSLQPKLKTKKTPNIDQSLTDLLLSKSMINESVKSNSLNVEQPKLKTSTDRSSVNPLPSTIVMNKEVNVNSLTVEEPKSNTKKKPHVNQSLTDELTFKPMVNKEVNGDSLKSNSELHESNTCVKSKRKKNKRRKINKMVEGCDVSEDSTQQSVQSIISIESSSSVSFPNAASTNICTSNISKKQNIAAENSSIKTLPFINANDSTEAIEKWSKDYIRALENANNNPMLRLEAFARAVNSCPQGVLKSFCSEFS